MNVWLFAGCMFLVAVFFEHVAIIWSQNNKKSEEIRNGSMKLKL
ncbi:hypothetical protein ACUIJ5_28065 (plasmid) [Bacillus toyonensis]